MKSQFDEVYSRYLRFSNTSFKIAAISFIVTFILVAINTGNSFLELVSRILFIVFISSLFEGCFLRIIARVYKNKVK